MRNVQKILAAYLMLPFSYSVFADDLGPTLQKIKDTGVISVGVRDSSVPFNYTVDGVHQQGYSYEIGSKIIEAVKVKLNAPDLKVKELTVTGQNRIPLLLNGTIDLECGTTTNNLERQKQVSFSTSIFIIASRLLVKKDSGVSDWADLEKKSVAVNAGSTGERLLRDMNDKKNLGINVISAKDTGQAFIMLNSDRAAAYMDDDALLYGERAKSRTPDEWAIVGTPASHEAYGCMLRKDPAFKQLADGVIMNMMKDGTLASIYTKWFQSPIPPHGLNINFPMSADVKALFASPNDKAFEE
ncbi:transporter substrate-binding domain-containing protein [Pseudomonas sp. BF-B-25]|uniref:transporter substrate-binding domain-containing protein n=1 Tax=Pseudomonas sp. BF-B-25 TaxID=2832355 RepID=UPI001CBB2609|nr:transporter substrate-binding domain-containing protein [Pseudomonas sp. BF-B-25]